MVKLAAVFLLTQAVFAEKVLLPGEEIEEGVSYAYPLPYDDTESFFDEEVVNPKTKSDSSKKESPPAWQGKIGRANVTVDVVDPDPLSEIREEWETSRKKNKPEKKEKKSRFRSDDEKDEEDKKDRSSGYSVKFSWPAAN